MAYRYNSAIQIDIGSLSIKYKISLARKYMILQNAYTWSALYLGLVTLIVCQDLTDKNWELILCLLNADIKDYN